MKKYIVICVLTAGVAALLWFVRGTGSPASYEKTHQAVFLSAPLRIDKKYPSMTGPEAQDKMRVKEGDRRLLWITGVKVDLVEGPDERSASPEFMCHANVGIQRLEKYRSEFKAPGAQKPRIMTLSQGQTAASFPAGFGYPVKGTTTLNLYSQVLNLNEDEIDKTIQQKISIDYVYDDEVPGMKALFPVNAYAMVALDDKSKVYGVEHYDEKQHGESCLPGQPAATGGRIMATHDEYDQAFSGHWLVPPGRQVIHSNVTNLLLIPYDTTVHYIAVHLHPFAESLELRDITANQTVFKALAKNYEDKIGLRSVDSYSSEKGEPMYSEHEYELVSVYDNTSDSDVDAMAAMYLFLHNKESIDTAEVDR